MAEKRFDWDTIEVITGSTKNDIMTFVWNVQTDYGDNFLVQQFDTYKIAQSVRNIVTSRLGLLSPEMILPPPHAITGTGSDKGYLIIIKPDPENEPHKLSLFVKGGFNSKEEQCLFLTTSYKHFIMDIIRIVSRLMNSGVQCELDPTYLCMSSDRHVAKFIKFNYFHCGTEPHENTVRGQLNNLFRRINANAGINGAPFHEFELFYKFISNPKEFNFSDIKNIKDNIIFWTKAHRHNFITALQDLIEATGCEIHYSETNDAFPEDWESKVVAHEDLKNLKEHNSRTNVNHDDASSTSLSTFGNSGSHLKNCILYIRDVYEYKVEILSRTSIMLTELDIDGPSDNVVDIMHFYFPKHVACLARGKMIRDNDCMRSYLALGNTP